MHVDLFFISREIVVIWFVTNIFGIYVIYVSDHIIMWIDLGYSTQDDPREKVIGKVTTGPNTRLGVSQGVFWISSTLPGYRVTGMNIRGYIWY